MTSLLNVSMSGIRPLVASIFTAGAVIGTGIIAAKDVKVQDMSQVTAVELKKLDDEGAHKRHQEACELKELENEAARERHQEACKLKELEDEAAYKLKKLEADTAIELKKLEIEGAKVKRSWFW